MPDTKCERLKILNLQYLSKYSSKLCEIDICDKDNLTQLTNYKMALLLKIFITNKLS